MIPQTHHSTWRHGGETLQVEDLDVEETRGSSGGSRRFTPALQREQRQKQPAASETAVKVSKQTSVLFRVLTCLQLED